MIILINEMFGIFIRKLCGIMPLEFSSKKQRLIKNIHRNGLGYRGWQRRERAEYKTDEIKYKDWVG